MTQNQLLLVAVLSVLSLIFQPYAFASPNLIDAKLNAPFTIKIGDTAQIKSENLMITLTNLEDSRCPRDVTCIWEGEVILYLTLKKGGDKSKETDLELKTSHSSEISFESYSISLSKVVPYPISPNDINKENYFVTLVVKHEGLSPLKQFKSGVPIEKITCNSSLVLVQKNNGSPACIKPEHSEKLAMRGWIKSNSLPVDVDAKEHALEVAKKFILNSPTFVYDGMKETLNLQLVSIMKSLPEQYVIEAKYSSRHGGYGDRTDQILTQVITPHTVEIIVAEGFVISAVTDGKWDELNHQYVLKKPGSDDLSMHRSPVHDYASLIETLQATGVIVELVEDLEDSSFSVPGKVISLDGEQVQVFEFSSATDAHTSSQIVSKDGTEIGTSVIRWIDTPHFYTQDRLIVLYVGHDQETLDLLENLLGSQFAGM